MKRLRIIITVCIVVLASAPRVFAGADLTINVRLSESDVTVGKAFAEIERQTGYIFAVNNTSFDLSRKVTVPGNAVMLDRMLDILLEDSGHTYSVVQNHIIIVQDKDTKKSKRAKASEPTARQTSPRTSKSNGSSTPITESVPQYASNPPSAAAPEDEPVYERTIRPVNETIPATQPAQRAGQPPYGHAQAVQQTPSAYQTPGQFVSQPQHATESAAAVPDSHCLQSVETSEKVTSIRQPKQQSEDYRFHQREVTLYTPGDKLGREGIPGNYLSPESARRPRFGLKTNAVYWATGTPNIGAEVGLGRRTSLSLMAGYNPWNLNGSEENNNKLVHWSVQPEFRYWLCERYNGHHFGVHLTASQFNIGGHDIPTVTGDLLFGKQYRNEGYLYGGGVSYGYHLMLGKRFGIEFTIGGGVFFLDYKVYECVKCGDFKDHKKQTYIGPTKAGINLVFLIK